MRSRARALASAAAAAILAAPLLCTQALSRQEIEGAKRYEKGPEPAYAVLDKASIGRAIRVRSARSYAVFGYNTPALVVELPKASNSSYAVVRFMDAKPLGRDGKPLPHEIEKGLYDTDTHSTQIRFVSPGRRDLVPLARATGRVSVEYPAAVRTTTVRARSPEAAELGIVVDGPYVTYAESALKMPEASSVERVEPLRAYDATGRRLERYDGFQKTEASRGVATKTVAFWGPVASVSFDVVDRWEKVERPFDLPAAPMRPAGREGIGP